MTHYIFKDGIQSRQKILVDLNEVHLNYMAIIVIYNLSHPFVLIEFVDRYRQLFLTNWSQST